MSTPAAEGTWFVGLDLAWGYRRPTGVAVLDDAGRLVEVASVRTDEEILALVSPYASAPCVVAMDAPLIVTNPTGNRPAERELNADFARFDAGAHPSNTAKPEFADGTRAGRLAARLGLSLDPASGSSRALEVYPHAATISLFGLGRTLKYKQKTGRDLELLRGELLALMGFVEGLEDAEPALQLQGTGWQALRSAAEQAARKADLRVVEDQVDAVVCAYVALFATRRPDDVTTYGTPETGVITTPTLPPDLEPTPRGAREPVSSPTDPLEAVAEYARRRPRLLAAEPVFAARVTDVLDDGGINYLSVTSRTKTVASFAEKAQRRGPEGERLYPEPMARITDQVGLRVITYVHADVAAVAELLHDSARVLEDRDWGRETASEGRFGYASRHLLLALDDDEATDGLIAQVQIRTVLQHAWAEFEHDIRYKGTVPPEHARDFDRRFTLAAGLLELADQEFATIRRTLRAVPPPPAAHPDSIEPRELAAFLAGQYDDAGWSRTDHYAWVADLLRGLGITSLSALGETLRAVDDDEIAARMEYRYPPGAVRRLDDALLLSHGEDYVALPDNAHRVERLRDRLARLRGG